MSKKSTHGEARKQMAKAQAQALASPTEAQQEDAWRRFDGPHFTAVARNIARGKLRLGGNSCC